MGKYWNLGLYDRSQLGASDSQLRYLQSLYGRSFRGHGLTAAEASRLIEEGLEKRGASRSGLSTVADQIFTHMMKRAIEEANAAGDAWLAKHPDPKFIVNTAEGPVAVHGKIGYAYITAPKRGSGLAKWLEEHGFNDRRNQKVLSIHHRHAERLEGELLLECAIAALRVLMGAQAEIGEIRVLYRCEEEGFRRAAA